MDGGRDGGGDGSGSGSGDVRIFTLKYCGLRLIKSKSVNQVHFFLSFLLISHR